MKTYNTSLLFGSGISIRANMPTTDEITKTILEGWGTGLIAYKRQGSEEFYLGHKLNDHHLDAQERQKYVKPILQYLNYLYHKTRYYFSQHNIYEPNYEHLYYIVNQIFNSYKQDSFYENPVVQAFIDQVDEYCYHIATVNNLSESINYKTNHFLANYSLKYIKDIVNSLLTRPLANLDYLELIKEINNEVKFGLSNIFTLNHDLVLENFLENSSINYFDGFAPNHDNIFKWTPSPFLNKSVEIIYLIKLHGSVNWYRLYPESEDLNDLFQYQNKQFITKLPENGSHKLINEMLCLKNDDIYRDASDFMYRARNSRPELIVGTYNKFKEYNFGISFELQFYYKHLLANSNLLIVSGYGFGDDAVNSKIQEWFFESEDNILLIIDPSINDILHRRKRNYFTIQFKDWYDTGKLKIINKPIDKTTLSEIEGLL